LACEKSQTITTARTKIGKKRMKEMKAVKAIKEIKVIKGEMKGKKC
jgi:hypothetical protein